MYDLIVVGARVGGTPTAMHLARAGHRVLMVDRATFPSDSMSTHYIHQPGVAALKRWDLLDRVLATGCPPITPFRFVGTGDLPNFFRKPWGPGWALVGDAGYHKDPVTGYGITDTFRDAETLAGALDAGLSGRQPLEEALTGYEERRNAVATPIHELICQMASMEEPPAEMQALLAALPGNQEATTQFWGVLDGMVEVADFSSPENIGRIMAAAQGRPAA